MGGSGWGCYPALQSMLLGPGGPDDPRSQGRAGAPGEGLGLGAGLEREGMNPVSLSGRVGEGRACWSLGNAYVSMGRPAQALTFAKKHLQISQEVSQACPQRPRALPSPLQTGRVHSVPNKRLRA